MKQWRKSCCVITAAWVLLSFLCRPDGYTGQEILLLQSELSFMFAQDAAQYQRSGYHANVQNTKKSPDRLENQDRTFPIAKAEQPASVVDVFSTKNVAGENDFAGESNMQEGEPKKMILLSAIHMVKDEKVWQKYKKLEKGVYDFVSFEYFKPFDKKSPSRSKLNPDVHQKGYGFTIYPKIDIDQWDNLGMGASFVYSETKLKCSYQNEGNISVEMFNEAINNFIGAQTSLGMTGSPSDPGLVLKIYLNF